jgi:hypothetical protein
MAETTLELAQYQTDHDILIELRTEMRLLRETIKESSNGVNGKIDDHEKRLRFIERWMWLAIGALALLQFVITVISTAFRL